MFVERKKKLVVWKCLMEKLTFLIDLLTFFKNLEEELGSFWLFMDRVVTFQLFLSAFHLFKSITRQLQ